jgi:surface protein
MALVRKKNGTNIIVIDKLSGHATTGGDLATGVRFDWVEIKVDTTISGDTASDQYTCDFNNINSPASLLVGWGDGTLDEYVYNDGKSQIHTYPTSGIYKVRYGRTNATAYPIPVDINTFADGDRFKKIDIMRFGEYSQVPMVSIGADMTLSGTTFSASDTPDGTNYLVIPGNECRMFSAFKAVTELLTIPNTLTYAGPGILGDCRNAFALCTNFNGSVGHLALTITKPSGMFNGCSSFNNGGSTDINNLTFDMSSGDNFSATFQSCTVFNQPIGNWNTAGCTGVNLMFKNAQSFNQDIGAWDMSSVTTIQEMFNRAYAFNNGGANTIGNWDLSAVNTASYSFNQTRVFNQDLTNWTAGAKTFSPTTINVMFSNSYLFNNGLAAGVSNGSAGTGMDAWNISSCTNLNQAFQRAESFNGYIGSWDVSGITSMTQTFQQAYRFNQDLSGWTFTPGLNTSMSATFQSATDFNNGGQPMDGWDVSGVTTFQNCFRDCTSFNASCSWSLRTTGDVTFSVAFYGASSFTGIGLENWNTERVTNFGQAFQSSALNFALTHPNYWELRSGVNVFYAFRLTPLNGGQASGVAGRNFEMRLSNSASDSYDLTNMFAYCGDFNQDISTDATNNYWDMSRVTNMGNMFRFCTKFNQNLNNWDTSACLNFSSMFDGATIFNQPLSNWDVSSATTLQNMFKSSAFDQDISAWNISSVTTAAGFLNNGSFSTTNYDLLLDNTSGWLNVATPQSNVSIDFSQTKYTSGGNAEAGRNILTGTYGWTIIDGGPV